MSKRTLTIALVVGIVVSSLTAGLLLRHANVSRLDAIEQNTSEIEATQRKAGAAYRLALATRLAHRAKLEGELVNVRFICEHTYGAKYSCVIDTGGP